MKCRFERLLLDYADGTLRGDTRAEMEGHLLSCESCSRRLDAIRSHRELFAQARAPEIPEGVWERIELRAATESVAERPHWTLRWLWKPAAGLAAAGLLITVSFFYLHTGLDNHAVRPGAAVAKPVNGKPTAGELDTYLREHDELKGRNQLSPDLLTATEVRSAFLTGVPQ
jgi:anti-sigma factor RsiW